MAGPLFQEQEIMMLWLKFDNFRFKSFLFQDLIV